MTLTDAQVRSFKPTKQRFKKSDGRGLYIEVMPTGGKYFRLACRLDGKQRTYTIGEYPDTSLAEARLKASEYKKSTKLGIDPTAASKEERAKREQIKPLWKDVAKDYLMLRQRSGAAMRTMQKLDRQINVTIKALGNREVTDISAEDVLAVVNPIADAGYIENAHEIRSRFSQVFRYAAARGLIKYDPAAMTIDAMVPRKRGEFAGLTDPKQVGNLLRDIHTYRKNHLWVGSAVLLSAYLFPRNTELRGMRWSEVDWEERLWEIPGDRMKMKREHIVPLPDQAIKILEEVKEINLGAELVFPAPRNPLKMMSDNTFNKALRSMGYMSDQHVHHGFRTTASTLLNELGWNADWIERQLAHVQQDKVRASYNKAQYLEGRRKMMEAYANKLDSLILLGSISEQTSI